MEKCPQDLPPKFTLEWEGNILKDRFPLSFYKNLKEGCRVIVRPCTGTPEISQFSTNFVDANPLPAWVQLPEGTPMVFCACLTSTGHSVRVSPVKVPPQSTNGVPDKRGEATKQLIQEYNKVTPPTNQPRSTPVPQRGAAHAQQPAVPTTSTPYNNTPWWVYPPEQSMQSTYMAPYGFVYPTVVPGMPCAQPTAMSPFATPYMMPVSYTYPTVQYQQAWQPYATPQQVIVLLLCF